MTDAPSAYSAKAIGGDTETFSFDRAFMAPMIVCAQTGVLDPDAPDGVRHTVHVTKHARDALASMLTDYDQIWFHNGFGFDAPAILASYPELAPLVWAAFERGAWLDTMMLQRMIQIARGDIGGPLALDLVCLQWGIKPPTKLIDAEWEGEIYDVRTSFGLHHNRDHIPEPWYGYADYDGYCQPKLAERMVTRYCTPSGPGRVPLVRLEDLAFACRTYFGLNLARVYGLAVDPTNVAALGNAAHAAIGRLREAAVTNGFLAPVAATRAQLAAGAVGQLRWCNKKTSKSERTRAKHANCPGCAVQGVDDNGPVWKLDTKVLQAAIVVAYDGKPPLTEPKKGKDGKKTGGGTIARSRDVLQDSGDAMLEAWAEYNEFSIVLNKDIPMFSESPVHAGVGITNNLRPSSFSPNVLNLRRDGFVVATCPNPECGYETTLDKEEHKAAKQTPIVCPACGQ